MSAIIRTEAIVLRRMKYSESSLIVTFYTRQFGKLSGIVKGARKSTGKYGASLQPMSYVMLVVYKKEGRELQTVSQCDLIRSFRSLGEDLEKMAVGMSMVELVTVVAHEEEGNVALFTLLATSLASLNDAARNVRNLLYHFELHLMRILGFAPSFRTCVSCQADVHERIQFDESYSFHLSRGGVLCRSCKNIPGPKISLSGDGLRILHLLGSQASAEAILDLAIDAEMRGELERFLWAYLQYHVAGMRKLKSTEIFSRILHTT
jgi:DNA repair protein RecO (recombination protein O)